MKYSEYNENKKHGTDTFPIEYYFVSENHLQYNMPAHLHAEFEIVRVRSGCFTLFVDNVKYEMREGDIAFIGCRSLHRGIPHNCVYECLVFDLNMLRKKHFSIDSFIIPLINKTMSVECLHTEPNDALSSCVDALFSAMSSGGEYRELEVFSLLYGTAMNLYREKKISELSKNSKTQHQLQIMTELLDWIDLHSREHISLADLAKVSGFSEKYLCRLFRETTSKTPIEYINHIRIENACHEIAHEGATITDAAFKCGFNNLNYFSKTFKKQLNMTPREYKSSCYR